MQQIARVPIQDSRFKIVHIHKEYVLPLQGICTFNGKLCIFNRQFDNDNVDIYLIPLWKRVKINFKIKQSKLKDKVINWKVNIKNLF